MARQTSKATAKPSARTKPPRGGESVGEIRNPLADDPGLDHRIRERAYHLWEAEGRVHGRDVDYWERARDLIGMETNPDAGTLPNPIALGIDPTAPVGVEEASIQENLGEFPDRLSDQGERQATPLPKKRRKKGES